MGRKSTVLLKRSIKITLVFELYLLYAYILHSDAEKIASIITRRYPRSIIIPCLPFILPFLSFFSLFQQHWTFLHSGQGSPQYYSLSLKNENYTRSDVSIVQRM